MVPEFVVIVTDNETGRICETRMFELFDTAQMWYRDTRNELYMKGLEKEFTVTCFSRVDPMFL